MFMNTRRFRLVLALIAFAFVIWNFVAWGISDPQEFGDTYRYFGSRLFDIQNPGITPVLFTPPWKILKLLLFCKLRSSPWYFYFLPVSLLLACVGDL